MNQIFFRILNISIMAGLLSIVVILLRLLFQRVPKWIICLLWAIVALRLIIPFNIESPVSLMPEQIANGTYVQGIVGEEQYAESSPVRLPETVVSAGHPETETFVPESREPQSEIISSGQKTSFTKWLKDHLWMMWAFGAGIMILYACFSFIRLKLKLKASVRVDDVGGHIKVYANDDIVSPFLLGLIRPVIYMPSALCTDTDSDAFRFVLKHEQVHVSRWDHIWKPFGFLLLSINWFNPLLWVAYILMCRDIEAACDEKVIKDLDLAERADYSRTLLALSSPRREIAACPVAFGENGTKSRIKAVLNYKKPAFWIIIAAIAICVVAGVCLLTIRPNTGNNLLLNLYLMEQASGDRTPHLSLNLEEKSFWFNWNQNAEIEYMEEGHYELSGNKLILNVEFMRSTSSMNSFDAPDDNPDNRVGYRYTFLINDNELLFLKNESAETPSFPDQAVFSGVDVVGMWLVEDGVTVLGEDGEYDPGDAYFLFGNSFDGKYALGCTIQRVNFNGDLITTANYFKYIVKDGSIIFVPDAGTAPDSPASYSFDSNGNMILRQWGNNLVLQSADYTPEEWKSKNDDSGYFYSFRKPIIISYSSENHETETTIPKGSSTWTAVNSITDYDYKPTISFGTNEETAELRFILSYDPLSSYLSFGQAVISNDKIICSTDDHKYTYVFLANRDDAYISFVFDEASSTVPNDFTQTIPDGTEFELTGEVESESNWEFGTGNTPLLTEDDIGLMRWNYAAQEDQRLADLKPIAIIGSHKIGLGVDPSDTNKFAYLAFSPTEDEYPAGWRIVVLEVSEPMVVVYNYLSDQILYTLYDGQTTDTDWEFGLNTTAVSTSEHFTSDELKKLSLADSLAQTVFDSIKDDLPEEMYPVALLQASKAGDIDYQILCATDASEGNGDIYVVQLTLSQDGEVGITSCDRLNMSAYVDDWGASTLATETELTAEELAAQESEAQLSEMAKQEEMAMQEIESQFSAEEFSANWDITDPE